MAAAQRKVIDNLVEIAKGYVHDIKRKYEDKYIFIEPIHIEGTESGYKCELKTVDNIEVGYCTIYTGIDAIKLHTRTGKLIDQNIFSVPWLGINDAFQGEGLGTALLLYAICELYIRYPSVTHITLDDDTSGVQHPLSLKHIYVRMGFLPRDDLVELSNDGRTMKIQTYTPNEVKGVSGPERITSIYHLIGAMVPKHLKEMEPVKNGGSRRKCVQKMRRAKKTHRVKKTRHAKKTRYTRR